MPYNVLAGNIDDVILFLPRSIAFDEQHQQEKRSIVEKKKREAEAAGGKFYDAPIRAAVLNEAELDGATLKLPTAEMTYFDHALLRQKTEETTQALYAAALIITPDERMIVGRAVHTEGQWQGKYNLPAGGVTLTDNTTIDAIQREMKEEIYAGAAVVEGTTTPIWVTGASTRERTAHPSIIHIHQSIESSSDIVARSKEYSGRAGTIADLERLEALELSPKVLLEAVQSDRFAGKAADVLEHFVHAYQARPDVALNSNMPAFYNYIQPSLW